MRSVEEPEEREEHGDDAEELFQEEPEPERYGPVAVQVEGAVRTRALPRLHWTPRTVTLLHAGEQRFAQIGNRDPRRAVLRVWFVDYTAGATGDVWIGATKVGAENGDEAILPSTGAVIELTHGEEVWLFNDDAAQDARVSYVIEQWAD